jgi:hypothetical protein
MASVTIADMERVALGGSDSRMDSDIGNTIELGDLGDDLGLSMLSNPSKVSVQKPSGDYGGGRNVNISSFAPPSSSSSSSYGGGGGGGSGNTFSGIDVSPLEPMEPISFSKIDSDSINIHSYGGQPLNIQPMQEATDDMFGNSQSATGPGVQLLSPARDPEAEKKEKSDYLNKLQRLEAKGFPVARKFTMDNGLEEIKAEYFRLVDARQLETSVKFQRQMLMGAITGMEWLNGRFDPFDLKLEGWSESVHENVEDFDEIFEELYDKYKDRGKMSPEMRLIMAVGGSGFMCHVSNTFFRSKMPSMDDVLRRNPELAKQMAAAAAQQAGPGFGNFMGMAMGLPQGAQGQGQGQAQAATGNGGPAMPSTGAFFGASAASPLGPMDRMPQQSQQPQQQQQQQTARREMSGPSGVDDILKTFEEVRRAEASEMSRAQPATGFATQPAVAAAVSGGISVASADDLGSIMSGATGATGGGRRRRRAQPPVGSTISLNV